MTIETYLYDADGSDERIELTESVVENLNDRQLLWVNILERDEAAIKRAAAILGLENVPFKNILTTRQRPQISKYRNFYHFSSSRSPLKTKK